MYGFVWRHLPGPWPVRAGIAAGLLAGLGALLWYGAFPLLDQWLPTGEASVGE